MRHRLRVLPRAEAGEKLAHFAGGVGIAGGAGGFDSRAQLGAGFVEAADTG